MFAFLTLLTYRIGEVFIHLSSEETQEYLESAKSKLQEEVKLLESQSGEVKALLGDLKVKLYAKFGNNINLEAEEEWKKSNIVASRLVAVFFLKYVFSLFNKRIRSAQFLSHFVSVNEASCLDKLKNNVSLNI